MKKLILLSSLLIMVVAVNAQKGEKKEKKEEDKDWLFCNKSIKFKQLLN